jgi:hypothetical protein
MSGAMKPLNAAEEACSPISSNCVIWQGPDIVCLDLCRGDSISIVIFKLACLVCDIKDSLDVDSYDLTCLNLDACDVPHDWKELFQLVIDKICELQALIVPEEVEATAETIVTVAACFTAKLGSTPTISAYIQEIGTKVCEQEVTIQNQQVAIQQLIARVEVLEATVLP